MRKTPDDVLPFDEDAARRIAHIIGESSAAAQALADIDMLKKNNMEYALMYSKKTNSFFVCYAKEQAN